MKLKPFDRPDSFKWSNKHWILLASLGIFILSVYYNLELQPLWERQERLQRQLQTLKANIQGLKRHQSYENFKTLQPLQDTQNTQIERALPLTWEMDRISESLLNAIEASQLKLERQVTAPESHYEHYVELTTHLELEGQYLEVLKFTELLAALPFLANIRGFTITNETLTSAEPLLKVQMSVSVYRRLFS